MSSPDSLVIRLATAADAAAIADLAALDSSHVPAGELLLAEAGGHLMAAVAVHDGRAIADPFLPTANTVSLLRTRAGQVRATRRTRSPAARRLRLRTASG